MGYSNATITTKGQELMTKVLAGESKITFSKMATSEKSYEEFESKQSVIPSIDKDMVDNTCRIRCIGTYSNASLTTGYYINTIVLYAKGDDGVEIAFSYIETDGTGKYMEAYNSSHPQSIQFTIYTGLTVNDETSVVVDTDGMVTLKYLTSKLTEVINTANTYTDTKVAGVVTEANNYTDTKTSETLTSAKSYSDTKLSEAKNYSNTNLATAKSYADTKLTEAKSYSDTNLAAAKKYAESLGTAEEWTFTLSDNTTVKRKIKYY